MRRRVSVEENRLMLFPTAPKRIANRILGRDRQARRILELEQSERRLSEELALTQGRLLEAHNLIGNLTREPESSRGPSIFLMTLPKSGSIYLLNMFQKGLGYLSFNVSPGYFPRDLADWQKVRVAARGGAAVQTHLDASPVNLQTLRFLVPRIQVHLRDPRQATLSMLHHLCRLWKQQYDMGPMLNVLPMPQKEFFSLPLEEQIDWMVEHYLPGCIQWISEWLAVSDGHVPGPKVLLTTFEQFLQDEDAFLDRTLEFFQVPRDRFVKPKKDAEMTIHFRQGTPDEWRRVYSPQQHAKAAALIPAEWKGRFGWRD